MTDLSLTPAALGVEPWRLWTGHLVHWDAKHLALNLFALLAPLLLLRRREAARIVVRLLALAPLASLAILASGVVVYRGASGLAVGFWCAAALVLWHRRDPVAAFVLLGLVAGKLTLEAFGVSPLPHEGYFVVPLAHQAGAVLGLAAGLAFVPSPGRRAPPLQSSITSSPHRRITSGTTLPPPSTPETRAAAARTR